MDIQTQMCSIVIVRCFICSIAERQQVERFFSLEACSVEDEMNPFICPCNRVENESRQKKAAAQRKTLKEEDPYGGSTDENTDAEAEQDHPIPDLPGRTVLIAASSCPHVSVQILMQECLSFVPFTPYNDSK